MAGQVVLTKDEKAALRKYEESLENLTFNSKPLIDDLTRNAGLLKNRGDLVVNLINTRIKKVAWSRCVNLPHFFLLWLL